MDTRRFIKTPTVYPFPEYYALQDVEALREIFHNSEGSEELVINLLTKRSCAQRLEIVECYQKKYSRDLPQWISSVYSSKFRKVVIAMLSEPFEFLARELEKSMGSFRTDDDVISEILCTRSNDKINAIQEAYERIYEKTLKSDLNSNRHLSSDVKDLYNVLLTNPRNEGRDTDQEKARRHATSIHDAIQEGGANTAIATFTLILTRKSFNQLCLIFDEYRFISGCSIHESIKDTFSGDIACAYLAIVRSAINKHQYYAEILEAALRKPLRRDDHTLIRILVSRCEIDLEEIKREYLRMYHKTLYNGLRSEISGPYKDIMLALLGSP